MVLDLNLNTDSNNKDPNNSTDTTKYGSATGWMQGLTLWSKTHPRLSFLGMLVFSGVILYVAVPWGLLFLLPDIITVYVVYGALAGVVAWYGSTKRLQHSYDPDVDIIYQNNSTEEPSIKRWKYKTGKFLDEYEFSDNDNTDPLIEFREDGTRLIQVLKKRKPKAMKWGPYQKARSRSTGNPSKH